MNKITVLRKNVGQAPEAVEIDDIARHDDEGEMRSLSERDIARLKEAFNRGH
jgi:hypothetical protein